MQIFLHQTHHQLADMAAIFSDLRTTFEQRAQKGKSDGLEELHLYPESYLTGYPLQDLVLQQEFIQHYQHSLTQLEQYLLTLDKNDQLLFLVGGLQYDMRPEQKEVNRIENVIYALRPGEKIEVVYSKKLLPNYDIFDEKKYYAPGDRLGHLMFNKHSLALLICEDMWFNYTHEHDPVKELADSGLSFDLVVNLSASPFFKNKKALRHARASEISCLLRAPFAYVNRVGGEDEILFDGGSFFVNGDEVLQQAKDFTSDVIDFELPQFNDQKANHKDVLEVDAYLSDLDLEQKRELPKLSPQECQEIVQAITFGLREYMNKCGFTHISLALSGGLDSGLVLTLCQLALNDASKIEAIYMPSQYSSTTSRELCEQLCERLGIRLRHFPIKFLHSTMRTQFVQHLGQEVSGLADENIQSRLRGMLMYARSNQLGTLVLNTSNKSEIAVGYSTLYGDSVGALSLLGDLYKSQVIDLANSINQAYDQLIPQELIDRPPTAELRPEQKDSDSLPDYSILDPILAGLLSYQQSPQDLVQLGFDQEDITKVAGLYRKSEYKRKQFCPILKLDAKSFGFGYRVPITKKLTAYQYEE